MYEHCCHGNYEAEHPAPIIVTSPSITRRRSTIGELRDFREGFKNNRRVCWVAIRPLLVLRMRHVCAAVKERNLKAKVRPTACTAASAVPRVPRCPA